MILSAIGLLAISLVVEEREIAKLGESELIIIELMNERVKFIAIIAIIAGKTHFLILNEVYIGL
jgi:hypothetical protein